MDICKGFKKRKWTFTGSNLEKCVSIFMSSFTCIFYSYFNSDSIKFYQFKFPSWFLPRHSIFPCFILHLPHAWSWCNKNSFWDIGRDPHTWEMLNERGTQRAEWFGSHHHCWEAVVLSAWLLFLSFAVLVFVVLSFLMDCCSKGLEMSNKSNLLFPLQDNIFSVLDREYCRESRASANPREG